jgi:hypothetical protein
MRRILCSLTLAIALTLSFVPAQTFSQSGGGSTERGNPSIKVWVNTDSGVYHCPNTRWYGNTKYGTYMTQKQAQEKGNRPAYGKVCQ